MVPFISAEELKDQYAIFGHFYSVELASDAVVECRSVLEIIDKSLAPAKADTISARKPDAVFIMMNPGSSQPLEEVNHRIRARAINRLRISLVPTKPDTTQYQVMRVMHYCGWRHVRVLNLSDLRCTKSVEFFRQFKRLEAESAFDAHSLFSSRRAHELAAKLTMHRTLRVVRAWGVSEQLDPLIERCTSKLSACKTALGLIKDGTTNKYLHPLPSLQTQKQAWVDRMVRQCRK